MGEIAAIIFLQIIAETFPISSSGHLILVFYVYGCYNAYFFRDFYQLLSDKNFMYALHIPTVILIVCLYAKRFIRGVKKNLYSKKVILRIIAYTLIADAVSVICIVILRFFQDFFPLWIGFMITASLLYSTKWAPLKQKRLIFRDYLILGLAQGIAATPGISRLGLVYTVSRWLGLSGKKSFDVSWQVAFPLMLGAGLMGYGNLIVVKDVKLHISFEGYMALLSAMSISCIGFLVAYRMACKNLWWLWSFYMLIPITISWILWMGYCFQ